MGAGAADRGNAHGGWVRRVARVSSPHCFVTLRGISRARRMSSAAPSPSPAPAPRATANPQPPTLLSLPIDVIYLILRQVKDTRSLVALFATCKVRAPSSLRYSLITLWGSLTSCFLLLIVGSPPCSDRVHAAHAPNWSHKARCLDRVAPSSQAPPRFQSHW